MRRWAFTCSRGTACATNTLLSGLAELSPVEQLICNQPVGGSNPFASSTSTREGFRQRPIRKRKRRERQLQTSARTSPQPSAREHASGRLKRVGAVSAR